MKQEESVQKREDRWCSSVFAISRRHAFHLGFLFSLLTGLYFSGTSDMCPDPAFCVCVRVRVFRFSLSVPSIVDFPNLVPSNFRRCQVAATTEAGRGAVFGSRGFSSLRSTS